MQKDMIKVISVFGIGSILVLLFPIIFIYIRKLKNKQSSDASRTGK